MSAADQIRRKAQASADMLDRRLRECDALGVTPSPTVLAFVAALCGLGLMVEVDPINGHVTARWRGVPHRLSWMQVDLFAGGPEALASSVRRHLLETPEAKDGAR